MPTSQGFIDGYKYYRCVQYASLPRLKQLFKLTDEQAKQIHKAQVRRKVFVNDRDRKSLACYSVEDVENLVAR